MDPRQLECVQHEEEIGGEVAGGIAGRIVRRVGFAMTALVVGDQPKAVPQSTDLVEPHPLSAGKSVQQDDRAIPSRRPCRRDPNVAA